MTGIGLTVFAQAMLDALAVRVCVLDERGTILAVNRAWRDVTESDLPIAGNVCEGADYLAVCDAVWGEGQDVARSFAAGVRAVLTGACQRFELDFPCHSPSIQRWFSGRVTRLASEGSPLALVAHEDITARRQAEQALLESEARLRAVFSQQLLSVLEEEKRRISAALHHEVGSCSVGVIARLDAVAEALRTGESKRALAELNSCRQQFAASVARLNALALELRPPEKRVSRTGPDARATTLTPQERRVLQLIADGYTSREIAALLGRSINTVRAHRKNLMTKLGVHKETDLVRLAVKAGVMKL